MRLVIAVAAIALGAGCQNVKRDTRASVKQRAAFDLKCPAASLKLTPLTEETLQGADSYGVDGCDQRAVYIRHASQNGEVWVLNTPHTASTSSTTTSDSTAPATQEGTKQ